MKVLRGILSESQKFYSDSKKKILRSLAALPVGSVKRRKIAGRGYYYLQQRVALKIVHKYLGKDKPVALLKQIQQRRLLKLELKKVDQALKMLKKTQGK